MTPKEFLLKRFKISNEDKCEHDALIAEYLYDDINDCELDELLNIMMEYAKLMCEKQKDICAEEAETKDLSGPHQYEAYFVIDKDSILNSPLPKELQDEN
jgi:hypothetical protein